MSCFGPLLPIAFRFPRVTSPFCVDLSSLLFVFLSVKVLEHHRAVVFLIPKRNIAGRSRGGHSVRRQGFPSKFRKKVTFLVAIVDMTLNQSIRLDLTAVRIVNYKFPRCRHNTLDLTFSHEINNLRHEG